MDTFGNGSQCLEKDVNFITNVSDDAQVAGMRSNLWPGAAAVASGAAFTNVYVGWGIKTAPFLPLPPPPVAQEYDQVHNPTHHANMVPTLPLFLVFDLHRYPRIAIF